MRKSARRIGQMIGLDSKEVNQKLAELGYLEGKPGDWSMTEEGRKHGEERFYDNGYGGYAARGWSYPVWDEDVARKLGDPDAHLREVNRNRKLAGLPPIKSWGRLRKLPACLISRQMAGSFFIILFLFEHVRKSL